VNRTYSLAEAAEQICGDSMKDPVLGMRREIAPARFGPPRRQALQLGVRIRAENGLVTHANCKL
jgi:hypothetical protein